jgi:hypothetical protein
MIAKFGGPAHSESPVALRPSLARGLPFRVLSLIRLAGLRPYVNESGPLPPTGNQRKTARMNAAFPVPAVRTSGRNGALKRSFTMPQAMTNPTGRRSFGENPGESCQPYPRNRLSVLACIGASKLWRCWGSMGGSLISGCKSGPRPLLSASRRAARGGHERQLHSRAVSRRCTHLEREWTWRRRRERERKRQPGTRRLVRAARRD